MNPIVITNQGQVKKFDVPNGWSECKSNRGVEDIDFLREFSPENNPEVKLSFYYRGTRIDTISGGAFLKILQAPEHELSDSERREIECVIRDAAEPDWFYIQSLRTDKLNQRKILVIEGTWLKNGLCNLALFFDTDKNGTTIQEIHYLAPENSYAAFLPVAIASIKTLEWK